MSRRWTTLSTGAKRCSDTSPCAVEDHGHVGAEGLGQRQDDNEVEEDVDDAAESMTKPQNLSGRIRAKTR